MATIWETRFNNHALWSVVDQMRHSLDGIDVPNDVDGLDSLARISWLIETLQAHREAEDVRGYTPTMLENVQRMLDGNVQNQLNQYVADPDAYAGNLKTAAQQIDSVVDQMGSWPALSPRGAAQAAGRTYASYVEKTNVALDAFIERRDDLSQEVDELSRTISAEKAEIERARKNFEADADEKIRQELERVSTQYLDQARASIDSINADRKQAREKRVELDRMEHEGNRILEAVANRAVAHDYRENARNKAVAGWVWDAAGLVVGGAPLVLLLIHFFQVDPNGQTSASLTLTRLGISIAAVGLAALCFRRGASNHKESRRAKRAHIRLSTAKPFIANQDEEFQNAIVQGMADRIYLQGILDDDDTSHDSSMLKEALQRVRQQRDSGEERRSLATPWLFAACWR